MDMRINTNSKQQSGRRLPNYGFVVFEEKQAVENLLSASKANSITYKNDKGTRNFGNHDALDVAHIFVNLVLWLN